MGFMPRDVDLWIYGDDTLVGFRNNSMPRGLTPPDLQKILKDRYGIYAGDWNIGRLSSYGDEAGATFLGVWNRDGLHGRPLAKWIDISLYPEKPRNSIVHQLNRMKYLDHAAVATKDNEAYFTDYFLFLNDLLPPEAQTAPAVLKQSLKRKFVSSHANFSSGSTDIREWEYGSVTTLAELKRPCRNYQNTLMDRQISGRSNRLRRAAAPTWLSYRLDGVPICICGVQREDVARVVAEAPALAL
uniref:RdRp n=1 Tax=viral metagenome TaxID=1070528 RepID=A0A2V0RKZ1_9ZZZZ